MARISPQPKKPGRVTIMPVPPPGGQKKKSPGKPLGGGKKAPGKGINPPPKKMR